MTDTASVNAVVIQPWLNVIGDNHVDPFLIWTLVTRFRQFLDGKMPAVVNFVVELEGAYDSAMEAAIERICYSPLDEKSCYSSPEEELCFSSPREYRLPLPGAEKSSKFITLQLPTEGKSPEDIVTPVVALIRLAGVVRIQIGYPRPEKRVKARKGSGQASSPYSTSAALPRVLLGVIEDACPYAHPALRSPRGGTRVWSLWDQTARTASRRVPRGCMEYGAEYRRRDLERAMAMHTHGVEVDEDALYRDDRVRQPRLSLRNSHSAAVIGLLAGSSEALPTAPSARTTCLSPGQDAVDRPSREPTDDACSVPLIAVQFPDEELGIALARWLSVRTLDGLRYIVREAAQISGAGKERVPLVVNISYGSMIGGHDGTSIVEEAMDEIIECYGEMAIVLAAGNAYGTKRLSEQSSVSAREPSGRHAVASLPRKGKTVVFGFYVPPDKSIESHLDIWIARPTGIEPPFLQKDDIKVVLTPPPESGDESVVLGCPDIRIGEKREEPVYGLFVLPQAAQSKAQSLVSLTVAQTSTENGDVFAPSGIWTVEITNESAHELTLNAWVERDILPGRARRQQSARLVPLKLKGAKSATLTDEDTFNNIATGKRTFRVGSLEAQCDATGFRVSAYSSAGASASAGPEFSAIADASASQPGIRVSGSTGGVQARMNGTSVAAPQAARWIANMLAESVSMNTIRKMIASSSNGTSRRGKLEV